MRKLSATQREERDEVQAVEFVYTTLSTEGVPITVRDAGLAYRFSQKNARNLRDENLRVSLDMIRGLREVRESRKGITLDFIFRLHGIIMAEYGQKRPGMVRRKKARIFLKSYERVEEIGFSPCEPGKIMGELRKLVDWYNASLGRLNPLELAALFHLRFYRIHPFDDGNKRMARLLFNKALFDCGYPIVSISKNTEGYFDSLIRCVELGEEKPFVLFVYNEFLAQMKGNGA